MVLSLTLIAALALIAVAIFRNGAKWPLLAIAAAACAALPSAWPSARPEGPITRTAPGEYVSSDACRSCHPSEHASWRRTFHRTMTQQATPETVRAPLARRDGRVWAKTDQGEQPVLLTTGSHWQEAYWGRGARGDLRLFPFVYLIAERRFIPRRDAFLQPPDAPEHPVRWNSNCIQCHSVAGQPQHDEGADHFASEAAELGIACEACHGPGGEHAAKHRNPFERYAHRAARAPDPTIVNPSRLSAERSSQICGQCHSYAYPEDEDDWWTHGYAVSYRPGGALERSRTLLTRAGLAKTGGPTLDAPLASVFWEDGTVRVGGREYNGMVASACYTAGRGDQQLSCTSCHAMHDSEPAGQLARGREGDRACLRCHATMKDRLREHTHHREDSAGSRCVECHMPKTSYALLRAVRSHRIDSPRALTEGDRLPACNFCHTDRSLSWSAGHLARWKEPGPLASSARGDEPSAVALWLLRGDAAKRAIAADALGAPASLAASGNDWQAPLLRELLRDPYAAVRFMAERSLRALPPDTRELSPELRAILAQRDDRPITISE